MLTHRLVFSMIIEQEDGNGEDTIDVLYFITFESSNYMLNFIHYFSTATMVDNMLKKLSKWLPGSFDFSKYVYN